MASTVLVGWVPRPNYVREGEPHGFPNASYSPAQFAREQRSISDLAAAAMIAYNKKVVRKLRRKKPPMPDLSGLTEDNLIYRRRDF